MVSNFKRYALSEAKRIMVDLGLDAYRGEQIFKWIWQKNVRSFSAMTNLSRDMRDRLNGLYTIEGLHELEVHLEGNSARKYVFGLQDGKRIESVYIRESKRRTVCVSCQVGCPLGCKFCATALSGFERNLLAYEIADQVRLIQEAIGEKCTNVVFMGMGEPFLNIDEIFKTLDIMSSPIGLAISRRHTTVSTAGLIQGMELLLKSSYRVKLAISLNFADEEKRKEFMPVARSNPLRELLRVAKAYSLEKTMVTFEYVMLRGINDGLRDAKNLRRLLSGIPAKINLIPFNEHPMLQYKRPTVRRLNDFYNWMLNSKHTVVIRKSRGQKILAGCGQLASGLHDKLYGGGQTDAGSSS
jgi:23S rRNA (adenine2503-C2)-methyltransferase